MSDSEFLALSSTHGIKVHKITKKEQKVKLRKEYNFGYGENAFKYQVDKLDDTFKMMEENLLSELLSQLEAFVAERKAVFEQDEPSSYRCIPCAMVSISSNIIRASTFIEHFKTSIKKVTPSIVTVASDCVQNIPDFVTLLQNSILKNIYEDDIENDFSHKFYGLTANFFHEIVKPKEPITVLFEDFDCFESSTLSDLLILMAENLSKLPIILICCKSSDVIALNMRLPARATDCLLIESFSCGTTRGFFYRLLEDICLNAENPFKLGPDIINHLIQVYHLWDNSLDGIFKRMKLCMFEHFFTKPFSRLCCPQDDLEKTIKDLSEEELKAIKALPSLQNQCPTDSKLLKSYLKKQVPLFRENFITSLRDLGCYHDFKELLPPKKELDFLQTTWIPFLASECFSESADFVETCSTFTKLPDDEITRIMHQFFEESDPESMMVTALRNHYTNFEEKIREEPKESINIYELQARKSNGNRTNGKRLTRQELLKTLAQSQKSVKKIEIWKKDFLDILKDEINKVNNPLKSPLNEIFFFNDLKSFTQYSLPSTREDVIETLLTPSDTLNCERCENENCRKPDITTVYEIYGLCLRVANLKQCFDSFYEEVNTNNHGFSQRKRRKDNEADQKEILTRFFSAISDLEYIGLLRAHPRKQDHIERLVWPTLNYSNAPKEQPYDSDDQISNLIDTMEICE